MVVKVKMIRNASGPLGCWLQGQTITLPEDQAATIVAARCAEYLDKPIAPKPAPLAQYRRRGEK